MLEDFLWWVAGKSWPGDVCVYVCLCKHFRPNGWFDWDGQILVRRAGTVEKRWCYLRTDRLHVARATCDRANPCKKSMVKGAGQTNGRIRLKLGGPIATMVASIYWGLSDGVDPFTGARGM